MQIAREMANRRPLRLHLHEILGFITWYFPCEVFSTLSSSNV